MMKKCPSILNNEIVIMAMTARYDTKTRPICVAGVVVLYPPKVETAIYI